MDKNPYFIKVLKEKAPILSDYVLKYNICGHSPNSFMYSSKFSLLSNLYFFPSQQAIFPIFSFTKRLTQALDKKYERWNKQRGIYISPSCTLFLSPADYCIFGGSKWVSWGNCAYDKDTEPWYNSTTKTKTTTRRFALTRTRNSPMEREKQII